MKLTRLRVPSAGALAIVMSGLGTSAALADGIYASVDVSRSSVGGVLSATRGDYTFGMTVTDYDGGISAGLSFTRRLPFNFGVEGLSLSAGPTLGFSGDNLSEVTPGLTASAQRFGNTGWGSYFLQASVGTVNRSFFLQAQTTFAEPGITLGLSRGGSTEYDEASLSISKRLGTSPVSLRAGYLLMSDQVFAGFSVNTF
ncbi:hypothetical protein [Halodurantibacterium flavum]|uniref:Porin n=1 Tax=Halodurantibacterium flavum TaxID=1382802 RepID=A0ABW4S4W7_9RHOB